MLSFLIGFFCVVGVIWLTVVALCLSVVIVPVAAAIWLMIIVGPGPVLVLGACIGCFAIILQLVSGGSSLQHKQLGNRGPKTRSVLWFLPHD
jgi:hypothetical protein